MNTQSHSRRSFLKTSALGAAGMMVAGGSVKKANSAWSPRMAMNPDIDNLRVVCCHDPNMIKQDPLSWSWANQNANVNGELIHANMDAMAMTLAQKPTAEEAWAAIFRKPAAKQWSQVRVAIKINSLCAEIMPRAAVVGKICMVLHGFGVPYSSMVLYDSGKHHPLANYIYFYNASIGKEIPAGVLVNNINTVQGPYADYLGGLVDVPVENFVPPRTCPADLANGLIDILVNMAVNKGHGCPGFATLTMKNHYGTFSPNGLDFHGEGGGGSPGGSAAWGLSITSNIKHDAIIGGNPVRQQLNIIDSLWALSTGNAGNPDCAPARLIMGTFCPIIDYLTIMKLRIPIMGSKVWDVENRSDGNSVQSMATDFGYTYSEFKALDFIPVSSGAVGTRSRSNAVHEGNLNIVLSSTSFKPAQVSFPIQLTGYPWQISITDLQGREIRKLTSPAYLKNSMTVTWNGTTESGMRISAGTYAVRITSGAASKSASIGCIKS